jgi:hypothetical protein
MKNILIHESIGGNGSPNFNPSLGGDESRSHSLQTELKLSAIAPDVAALNFRAIEGPEAWELLLYGLPASERRNDGRLRNKWLATYAHLDGGGWYCGGVDILTGQDSLWGCLKPNEPRRNNDKIIKYEHPPKVATEAFFLRVPPAIARKIAARHGLEAAWLEASANGVSFWQWVLNHPEVSIIITEGSKKAASLLSDGFCAVALPGIFSGYRAPKNEHGEKVGPPCLIPQLEAIAQKGREITFAFDNDPKPKTRKNVAIAIDRTARLLTHRGCVVSVMEWGQAHPEDKGIDDVHYHHGPEALEAIYQGRENLYSWHERRLLDISPYVSLSVNERYLQDHAVPDWAVIVGVKGPKGTAKSTWLSKRVAENVYRGDKSFVKVHRIQLGRAIAANFGLPYVDEIKADPVGDLFGKIFCVDSMRVDGAARFNPEDYHGATIILDEVEQFIWHLLSSTTEVGKHRVEIIQNLAMALRGARRIYLSDADLSPIAIEFIQGLLGYKAPVWVLENTWQPPQGTKKVYRYQGGSPDALVSNLTEAIANGEKALIHTSGQKEKSKWGTQSLESMLLKRFPDKSILRIDAESVADPGHPAYGVMERLNDTLGSYDIVIASPTIETGVSIDMAGHFNSVWAIAWGIQTVEAVAQALERLRENVPRHVWVNAQALPGLRVGAGEKTAKSLLHCTHARVGKQIAILTQAGIDTDGANFGFEVNQAALWAWARRGSQINRTIDKYADCVFQKLEDEGYEVLDPEAGDTEPDTVTEAIEAARDENYQRWVEQRAIAPDVSYREKEALEKKRALTKTERAILAKASLKERYGVEITSQLIEFDDDGGYSKLRLLYHLTTGKDYAPRHYGKRFESLRDEGNGAIFKPDADKRLTPMMLVKVLEMFGIEMLLEPGREWHKGNLEEWHQKLLDHKSEFRKYLGLRIAKSPIEAAKQFLDMVGLGLEAAPGPTQRSIPGVGDRVRVYRLTHRPAFFKPVMAHWLEKDAGTPDTQESELTYGSGDTLTANCNRSYIAQFAVSHCESPEKETALHCESSPPVIPQVAIAPDRTPQQPRFPVGVMVWFWDGVKWLEAKIRTAMTSPGSAEYIVSFANGGGAMCREFQLQAMGV